MRRVVSVATVILIATLVVLAQPAAAASHLATASVHTTDTDFQNANTLDNVSVTGSGTDASISLDTPKSVIDDFEDGDIAEYGGDTGSFSTTTTQAYEGSYGLVGDGGGSAVQIADTDPGLEAPINISTRVYISSTDNNEGFKWFMQGESATADGYLVQPKQKGGKFQVYIGSPGSYSQLYSVNSNVPTGEWVRVNIQHDSDGTITITVYDSAGNQVQQESLTDSTYLSGGIGFHANQGNVYHDYLVDETTPDKLNGTYVSQTHLASNVTTGWTDLTLTNTTADVTWLPDVDGDGTFGDGQAISASYTATGNHTQDLSSVDAEQWRVNVTFTPTESSYTAELHDEGLLFDPVAPRVDNSTATPDGTETNNENVELSADVLDADFATAQGDEVTVEAFVDGASIGAQTITSNQTVNFTATGLSDGNHTWHYDVVDDYGETATSDTFTFQVNHYAPRFDNASASPSGGTTEETQDVNLSIDVTDRDFAEDSGDTVDVEFFIDGSSVGTDTLTANGTAIVSISGLDGGNHTWHATATDEYGKTADSDTFEFSTPGTLYIRDESNPTQLIDNASVELRFYFEDDNDPLIVNRTSSNGEINMTGLPTDQPFVVVAESDGYYPRRIYKESLLNSQNIYLLNQSKKAVEPTFQLVDYSGVFPEDDTVMLIQRALTNESGVTDWRTVQGDRFGATGQFPAQLRYNKRHRLILINTETGARLNKKQYTPTTSDPQEVRVLSTGEIELQNVETIASIGPNVRSLVGRNGTVFTATIDAGDTTVDSWTVTATYDNGNTSEVLYEESGTGTIELQPALNLSGRGGGQVNVTVEYTLASGTTGTESATFVVRESYQNEFSLLAVLASVTTLLPGQHVAEATSMFALVFTLIGTAAVASTVRPSTEGVGLIAVAFVSGFYIIGWLSRTTMFIAAVAWLAIAGLRRGL